MLVEGPQPSLCNQNRSYNQPLSPNQLLAPSASLALERCYTPLKAIETLYSLYDERGHLYLSNGEGPMSIDASGALWGPFLGPIFPKNWYFADFLENDAYDFFIFGIRIGDINTYQTVKIAFKLIHFFRSYSPKIGGMTSSSGTNSARS